MHKDENCTTLALRYQKSLQAPKMNNVLCFFLIHRKSICKPMSQASEIYINITGLYQDFHNAPTVNYRRKCYVYF